MFKRFSDASRHVVVLAQDEARGLGHGCVGTEHILLGLLAAGDSPAAGMLHACGITDEDVREHIGRGDEPAGENIAFSPRAKEAIEAAFRAAQRRGTLVEPSHLLLGVLSQVFGRACEVMQRLGIDLRMLEAALRRDLPGGSVRFEDVWVSQLSAFSPPTMRAGGLELLDRLSDAALAGLAAGQLEARRLGQDSLSPEFLMLGLLATEGEARDALVTAGASERAAREALEVICPLVEAAGGPPLPDESVRRVLSDCQAGAPGEPIRSSDLLREGLGRSAGAWMLLRAAGADLAVLKKLTSPDGGRGEGGRVV
ncbi:MAG: Clp protease N-terminal domain-containing protein [Egibacteraceae bacterium]